MLLVLVVGTLAFGSVCAAPALAESPPAFRDTCRYPPAALRSQGKNGLIIQDSLGDWDFRPLLARLQIPALVVEGAETVPLDATREWATSLPNGRLFLVPGSGHMPFVDQPEAFFGPVIEFLRGTWPPEAQK